MIGETITIVRGAGRDKYGDPIAGLPQRIEVPGCAVAPRGSDEPTERGRAGVITGLTVYAPPGTDIRHTDQVERRGVLYDIEGDAGEWDSPYSADAKGVEFALRRATG